MNNENMMMSDTNKMQDGWVETTLEDVVAKANTGLDAIKRAPIVLHDTGIKCLRIQDVSQKKVYSNWGFTEVTDNNFNRFRLKKDYLMIARTGASIGVNLIVKEDLQSVFNNGLIRVIVNEKTTPKFIAYVLSSQYFRNYILSISQGTSTQQNIQIGSLLQLPIVLPTVFEQEAIAGVLSSLDDKIELLRKQNETLEALAQTIFKEWFVNFNFPDRNGKPYKDSSGKMIDSELGPIPHYWRVGKLSEVVQVFDSKRVPLSKGQREKRQGQYPYHGATSIMDYVDDYLFDGIYLLLAEDGSVMDDKGYPVLQYVWGKMWVNNHAHVLTGQNDFCTEMLYLYFRRKKIASIVTGAVQLKINQTNLLGVDICIPDKETLQQFSKTIEGVFAKIRSNHDQIATLGKLRDTLLPKLMSGQVRVRIE